MARPPSTSWRPFKSNTENRSLPLWTPPSRRQNRQGSNPLPSPIPAVSRLLMLIQDGKSASLTCIRSAWSHHLEIPSSLQNFFFANSAASILLPASISTLLWQISLYWPFSQRTSFWNSMIKCDMKTLSAASPPANAMPQLVWRRLGNALVTLAIFEGTALIQVKLSSPAHRAFGRRQDDHSPSPTRNIAGEAGFLILIQFEDRPAR